MKRYLQILAALFLLWILSVQAAHAQQTQPYQAVSVPTSPQAEAFRRYGDVAVNPGTGVPDISIPLFEIEHHGYRLPLSLRYSPSPLTPGYNYDVFGRGWALSVSSCISRSIEGMPDERCGFELDTDRLGVTYRQSPQMPADLNLKHDCFTATLPDGSSFDFIIRKDIQGRMEHIVSGGRKVKISHTASNTDILTFTVTDENGVEYKFTGADTSFMGTGSSYRPWGTAYVSWQLTSIRLPHSQEPVTFAYGKTIESDFGRSETEPSVRFHHFYDWSVSNPNDYDVAYGEQTRQYAYRMKLLTGIYYGGTSILIDYADDAATATYNHAGRIRILDGTAPVRTVSLAQRQYPLMYGETGMVCSLLDSVTVSGGDLSYTYGCTYAGGGFSFSGTDHWGYLNQASTSQGVSNMTLFMEFDVTDKLTFGFARKLAKDADDVTPFNKVRLSANSYDFRAPSSAYSHRLLKRLTYPTGGYTEFAFENHEFMSHTDASGDYIPDKAYRVKKQAAGFRIREIADYAADGTRTGSRRYCYGPLVVAGSTLHTGAGVATADPTVETYMSYEATNPQCMPIPNMVKGLDPDGRHEAFANVFLTGTSATVRKWEFACTFSVLNFRRLVNGRQSVVYPEVTVYHTKDASGDCAPSHCDGKTVYRYSYRTTAYPDTPFIERPKYSGHVLYYEAQPHLYGLLKEQCDYRSDGSAYRLVRRETRSWSSTGRSVMGYDYDNPFGKEIPAYSTLRQQFSVTYRQLGHSTLTGRSVQTYDPETEASFAEGEQYSYAYGDVLSQTTRHAGSRHRTVSWTRPQAGSGTDSIVRKLLDKNLLSPVLEETRQGGDGWRCEYGEFETAGGKILMPARIYDTSSGTDYFNTEFLSYTSNGNPLETVTKDGLHTVYLWSYGDRCLVAEIRNATLQQTEAALDDLFGKDADAFAQLAVMDEAKLRNLRNQSQLAGAQVTVFTHKPLVGVTSITDPSGKTVYYEYDALGRLKESYYFAEGVRRTLEEYEYHYRNQ